MGKQPIFLNPVFKERIWGGTTLRDEFGYSIPSDETGEAWAISAHPNGQSTVRNGQHEGASLGELWKTYRHEVFGNASGEVFPLLTKILDANKDLSVQVHPDDTYAKEHENGELGKTECWYIIDCKDDAELIYGHHARTRRELEEMIENGQWGDLLRRVKIKPGDFFYVPSGTIHALGEGTLVLETQQSSDTTYRVYDYDRVGADGQKRELHLAKAIDVTTVPHVDGENDLSVNQMAGGNVTTLVNSEFFTVYKWEVKTELKLSQDKLFMLGSVIAGEGQLTNDAGEASGLKKGDHFILPYGLGDFVIHGELEVIVSHL
ncbi:mannose-6-phosphate isomerase, class I [Bacillus marinisedimentorum]|uniref:mannose-6-phosphate isomerase, class I n=1 Tax=Bacillus marinisedimentorum TaxID=1821260 RepID=UPI0007DED12F|nr:mannose-6-phosphate isomerase, class I [Bacillus marinisedimentorum]